jgi:hypothetical protein
MIYDIITETDFHNSKILRDAFSYEAITALFEWYDELSESCDIEFDPVAIRCDWSEYDVNGLFVDYSYLLDEDERHNTDRLIEVLEENTTVIRLKTTYLIEAF